LHFTSLRKGSAMPRIYQVLEITADDFDDSKQYIGEIDLSDTDKSIAIAPNLGTVVFQGSIGTPKNLSIGKGTKAIIFGDIDAIGINACSSLKVTGKISSGGDIHCNGHLIAESGIYSFMNIYARHNILSYKEVRARFAIKAGRDIFAGGPIKAVRGAIAAGGKIDSGADIRAGLDIRARLDIRAFESIHAGSDIVSGGEIFSRRSVTAGGRIVAKSTYVVHNLMAGSQIKAETLIAGRIFAGMNGERTILPGEDTVQGEIATGVLAYGQHVAA